MSELNSTSDILRAFLTTIDKTMEKTHVSDVCKVLSISDDGYWAKVQLINQTDVNTEAFIPDTVSINVDDIILIIYTDLDTRANLKKILDGKPYENVRLDTIKHTINNAIVIMKLLTGEEE